MPPPLPLPKTLPLKFGPHAIPPSQIFHISPRSLTFAVVNLKPLLPGHVLICPVRCTLRFNQLTVPETTDLFMTVRRVSRMVERVYRAEGMNIAIQDGEVAGQSVPHVHVHVIPRRRGDMDGRGGGDKLYEMLEGEEGDIGKALREMGYERTGNGWKGPHGDGEDGRTARTEVEMGKEAEMLRVEIGKEPIEEGEGCA